MNWWLKHYSMFDFPTKNILSNWIESKLGFLKMYHFRASVVMKQKTVVSSFRFSEIVAHGRSHLNLLSFGPSVSSLTYKQNNKCLNSFPNNKSHLKQLTKFTFYYFGSCSKWKFHIFIAHCAIQYLKPSFRLIQSGIRYGF